MSKAGVGPVRSVRDQITDQMRDDLLCGRFAAGDRLSEQKLADSFGVSRGLIRESLAQLTSEGLLVSKPNCGVTVAAEPTDEIREVITPIRRTIEVYALRSIYESLTDRDFRAWEEILHRMELACQDSDEEAITLNDIAFHRWLIVRADNPDLLAIWQAILVRVRGYFRQVVHRYKGSFEGIHADHRKLLDVFRKGDKEAALWALEEHVW